jgi:hypothetical protein
MLFHGRSVDGFEPFEVGYLSCAHLALVIALCGPLERIELVFGTFPTIVCLLALLFLLLGLS